MFYVGQKVRIKPRDEILNPYGLRHGWDGGMDQYCGRIVTISEIGDDYCHIKETDDDGMHCYYWLKSLLLPVDQEVTVDVNELEAFL